MKKLIFSIVTLVTIAMQSCTAQIKNAKTETVKVFGNCGKCKKNIETAAYQKKVATAVWDKENKTALLTYDSILTTADVMLKRIALAGYDNQNYLAPDDAYAKLDMCCQYERKKPIQQVSNTSTQTNTLATKQDTLKNVIVENELEAVYTTYFELKNALTKDDGTAAAEKAKELFKAVDGVAMEKLTATQHSAWMKYMEDISYNAEHIKGTTELEHQREHFAKLSAAMIELMKIIKPNFTVYINHCPMFNDGKGANWLSKENQIKNPYYGNQMLTCGSIKETIKPNE